MKYKEDELKIILDDLKKKLGNARLMAVSKTRTIDEIDLVYRCGVTLFGENKVQEIVEKFSGYRPKGLELHLIGHLQSNKVSKVVPLVDMIESIDSFSLLQKVNVHSEKINKIMPVLLEFKTTQEENKSGFVSQDELFECVEKASGLKNIVLRGLMTVGPVLQGEDSAYAFRKLRTIFKACIDRFPKLSKTFTILSMGMSSDWETALKEGSNLVRLGTAIFGDRNYKIKTPIVN